jgi:hypothetical protein
MPASFAASYDRVTKIVSAVVCLGLGILIATVHNLFVACISAAVVIFGYAYSPRGYVVADGAIVVKRLIGNVRVPLQNLREARITTPEDMRGGIRLWGSGGMFGYYGLFRTSKLGKCTWYATNRRKMLIVVTESKTTLYSPDDVDGFLTAVQASTHS